MKIARAIAQLTGSAAFLVGAVGLGASAPLAPANTALAAQIITLSGQDATTGSTTSTTAGNKLNWTIGVDSPSATSQTVTDSIAAPQGYVAGSLKLPPGWSATQQPANGGQGQLAVAVPPQPSTAPGVLSQATTVPGSTFLSNSQGTGDGWDTLFYGGNVYNLHHHYFKGEMLSLLECHDVLSGAVCPGFGADGINITGTIPAGLSFAGPMAATDFSATSVQVAGTASQSFFETPTFNGAVITASGDLYFGAQILPNGAAYKNAVNGIGCIDLAGASPAPCATFFYPEVAGSSYAKYSGADFATQADPATGYLWSFNANTGGLYCFNPATATATSAGTCGSATTNLIGSGYPTISGVHEGGAFTGLYLYGSYLFGTTGQTGNYGFCFDTSTMTPCWGGSATAPATVPLTITSVNSGIDNTANPGTRSILPLANTTGVVDGACYASSYVANGANPSPSLTFQCVSAAASTPGSASESTPSYFQNLSSEQAVFGFTPYDIGAFGTSSGLFIGTDFYFPVATGNLDNFGQVYSSIACLDFATGAACSGFNSMATTTTGGGGANYGLQTYTVRQDPAYPGCLWELGNTDGIQTFSAATGGPCSVSQEQVTATATPTSYYCSPSSASASAISWTNVAWTLPTGATSASIKISGPAGTPSTTLEETSSGSYALKGYTTATDPTLTAVVTFTGDQITGPAPGSPAGTVSLSWSGADPQICFQTTTTPACLVAGLPPITNQAVLTGAAGTVDSNQVSLTEANLTSLCPTTSTSTSTPPTTSTSTSTPPTTSTSTSTLPTTSTSTSTPPSVIPTGATSNPNQVPWLDLGIMGFGATLAAGAGFDLIRRLRRSR